MISERMDHPSFDDKRTGTAIDQSHTRTLPIDTLPTELLERVIGLGATKYQGWKPEIKWICEWRRVCWKWAFVIDHCSALWSYIVASTGTRHVRTQLEKSKEAPLIIEIGSPDDKEEWIRHLVDNVHRWESITFRASADLQGVSAMLDSPPSMLEALKIYQNGIPSNSKLFNPPSHNLRSLVLSYVSISSKIQPPFGLEVLDLSRVHETQEGGTIAQISGRKLQQYLQASPGLQVLKLGYISSVSAADESLQPVDLPNLKELGVQDSPVLHLLRAEHCASVTVTFESLQEKLPPAALTTVLHTLRRAKGLEVHVSKYSLTISSLLEPPTIRLRLSINHWSRGEKPDLSYSMLEEILQELENESCISARIQLALWAHNGIGVKVLKLLQSPMPGPSPRWRLPHLDKVCIYGTCLPYQYLQEFVQARANAQGDQAPQAVTSILECGMSRSGGREILGEVMDYTEDEGVADGAVVQAG